MPDGPRLAVIITCFNYEAYVAQAIRSVLEQGRDDCELVVVDDGSTDRSWDVIGQFGVKAFRTVNAGQRAACLFGLDRTRAPFALFLDADDELHPGALDTIVRQLDPAVAKLQFPLTRIDAAGHVTGGPRPQLEAFRDRERIVQQILQCGAYVTPPTSGNVFRRDVCELLREATYDRAVDGIILVAAPFFGDIVSLSEALGSYRVHGRNDSGLGRDLNIATMQRDAYRFVQRTDHLRSVMARRAVPGRLTPADDAFYLRDLRFSIDIMSGQKHPLGSVWRLFRALAANPGTSRTWPVYVAFVCLAELLPRPAARALVAYRQSGGSRSLLGLLRKMMAGAGSSETHGGFPG